MAVKNPRFPHWCRIIRKTVDSPLEDEDDFSPLDTEAVPVPDGEDYAPMGGDDGDPAVGDEPQDLPGDGAGEEETSDASQTSVIYEGECRSYSVNTTSDKGDVISSYRGLALPLNQDGWMELGVVPQEGDEIVVDHGGLYKEYGHVIDKNIATASFAGTHVTWRYGRN